MYPHFVWLSRFVYRNLGETVAPANLKDMSFCRSIHMQIVCVQWLCWKGWTWRKNRLAFLWSTLYRGQAVAGGVRDEAWNRPIFLLDCAGDYNLGGGRAFKLEWLQLRPSALCGFSCGVWGPLSGKILVLGAGGQCAWGESWGSLGKLARVPALF